MKQALLFFSLIAFTINCMGQPGNHGQRGKKEAVKGYQIGDVAEDFALEDVNGDIVSLSSFEDAKGYIIVFTSNECPFAKAYEDRLIKLHTDMSAKGYPVIAINSNDGAEGAGNTIADMLTRHEEKDFPFVYLKDAKRDIFPKFGATKTPEAFLLDSDLTVRYTGAIDDNSNSPEDVEERYVEMAVAALENGTSPEPAKTKAIGCAISSKGGKGGPGGGPRGRKGPPNPDQILADMDADNDNKVSKEEARGPLSRDFDRLDADKDGMLTKEELAALHKRK